jgi:protein-disulfide isomerase
MNAWQRAVLMSVLQPPILPNDHVRGAADAAITLVEYGDFECRCCAAAHSQVRLVEQRFGKQLRFAFRHFPLTQIHPLAEPAAEAAEVAAAHDCFWEMHDGLYENREEFGLPLFHALAEELDIPQDELSIALATKRYAPKIQSDFRAGVRSGVNGTPTFFINGVRHDGGYQFEELASAVQARL